MRKLALILWALVSLPTIAVAQPINKLCYINSSGGCTEASSANPFPVTGTFSGSVTVTFPTIGAAVPATGIYNGINIAGTLRGVTGLSLGSTFSQTVAIVDASGNQITSFGSSAAVGATGAAVPASANYVGINVGGTLTGWTGAVNAGTNLNTSLLMLDTTGQSILSAVQGDVPSVTGPLNAATAVATKSLMIGAQYLSSAPTYTNTQQGALLLDVNGNLNVNVKMATGLAQGSTTASQTGSLIMGAVTTSAPTYTTAQTSPLSLDTAGALRVSGTVTIAANQSVNVAQINGVTPLMGNGVTGTGSPRVTIVSDGTAISTTGYMSVKIDQTTPGTTNAVSIAQIAGTTILNGGVAGSQSIGGTVATNVAINANPINLGAQAVSSENSAVTTARQVQLVADLVGKLIVMPYANPENFVSGVITSAMTGTTTTSLVASPSGSLRNYITQITCYNTHASVGTDILVQDGSGGTTIYLVPAAIAYGGAVINFPTPLRQPTTATALFVANVTTGASTKCAASGYKGL